MRDATSVGMATITTPVSSSSGLVEETVYPTAERSFVTSPIGWSSILAATVVSLGVWLALHIFGIGVGMTAIDPQDAGSLRGVGIGVGIWSMIAPILALFVGGLVAGRMAPTINTLNAAIHGAVVWALATLLAMMMVVNVVGSLMRGAVSAGSAVASTATSAAGALGGEGMDAVKGLGIDADDLFAPINKELAARGVPPVQPEQAKAVAQEAVKSAVRGQKVDREQLIAITTRNTNLSRQDAEQVATELERQMTQLRQRGEGVVQGAQETALGVAENTGKILIGLFAMMALTLAAAVVGSILSVRRERRTHVVLPRAQTQTTSTTVS